MAGKLDSVSLVDLRLHCILVSVQLLCKQQNVLRNPRPQIGDGARDEWYKFVQVQEEDLVIEFIHNPQLVDALKLDEP